LDLPQPLGPTTDVTGDVMLITVLSQKDLKPMISIRLMRTYRPPGEIGRACRETTMTGAGGLAKWDDESSDVE
jgi:hypothetical protein